MQAGIRPPKLCPESFGYAQEGLVEGLSAWRHFRDFGLDSKSVGLNNYVRCAGNANSCCRSHRLIPAYRDVEFASNVFSEACSVWEVEKESHGLPIILGYSAVASNLTMKINGYSDVVDSTVNLFYPTNLLPERVC